MPPPTLHLWSAAWVQEQRSCLSGRRGHARNQLQLRSSWMQEQDRIAARVFACICARRSDRLQNRRVKHAATNVEAL
jgi:hypothetical protein